MLCVAVLLAVGQPRAEANLPSRVNGDIAFQHNDDPRGEIWVLDPASASAESSATKLTAAGVPEARPAWGPKFHGGDAHPQHLAFQRLQDGDWDIWDRVPPTGSATPLVVAPGDQVEPVYSDAITPVSGVSASGKALLAYVSDQTGSRELWIRDGSDALIQLTADGLGYANPDFGGKFHTVTGTSTEHVDLVFESTRGGPRAIWAIDLTVDPSTGKLIAHAAPRRVVTGPEELFEPSWQVTHPATGDRRSVVDVLFTTREFGNTYLDYVEEARGRFLPFSGASQVVRHQLTGDPGGDSGAVWAPFGDQIAFTRSIDGNADVWVMKSDGTNLRRLTEHAGPDLAPSWQPDVESSADIVGGHTAPAPVTRTRPTPGGGGAGDGGGTNSSGGANSGGSSGGAGTVGAGRKRSPRLALDRVRWRGRRVTIAGHAARDLSGRVTVSFRCGSGRARRISRRVRLKVGRLRTTLTTPRRCRRARRATVRVVYVGDNRFRGQTVKASVRRR